VLGALVSYRGVFPARRVSATAELCSDVAELI
jgi:hypothetical protein